MRACDGEHLLVVRASGARLQLAARDREKRHEGDALLAAAVQQAGGIRAPGVEAVVVLDADHWRDGLGLRQMLRLDAGDTQVSDQPGITEVSQGAEVVGNRVIPAPAQVDDVEVIAAELPQVLLDLAAQLLGRGHGQPLPRRIPSRSDLGHDDQVIWIRCQRAVDQFVGGAQRREVERGGVDMVHAQFDRAAQDSDRAAAVDRRTIGISPHAVAGKTHRAEADSVDFPVAEHPGARRCRGL